MALSHGDYGEIQKLINKAIGQQGEYFVVGRVIKSDNIKKLVWLSEFGDQPIPIIGFDYQVKYYYVEPFGVTTAVGAAVNKRTAVRKTTLYSKEVEILVPRIGELVLVAKHMGSDRLPKCLGVVKGVDYVQTEGDDD
jgi:hypothetical protein